MSKKDLSDGQSIDGSIGGAILSSNDIVRQIQSMKGKGSEGSGVITRSAQRKVVN